MQARGPVTGVTGIGRNVDADDARRGEHRTHVDAIVFSFDVDVFRDFLHAVFSLVLGSGCGCNRLIVSLCFDSL